MNDHKAHAVAITFIRDTRQDVMSDEGLRQRHHRPIDFLAIGNEA